MPGWRPRPAGPAIPIATLLAVILLAGGCASPVSQPEPVIPATPPPIVWEPPPEPVKVRPTRSTQFRGKVPLPKQKPAPEAAPLNRDPEQVIGLTLPETATLLGAPSVEEDKAPAKIWLYSTPNCAFKVYFYPELDTLVYRALRFETEPEVEVKPGDPSCFATVIEAARGKA